MRTANRVFRLRQSWHWTVLRGLLATVFAVYLLQIIAPLLSDRAESALYEWLALSTRSLAAGKVWTLLTYSILHADFWHFLNNMFFLWAAGRTLEQLRGGRFLLFTYIGGALLGGLTWVTFLAVFGEVPMSNIGSSGGVYAVLAALLLAWKDRELAFHLFFIPVTFPIKAGLWILCGLTVAGLILSEIPSLTNWWPVIINDDVAHLCHLGGFLFALGTWLRERHKLRYPSFRFRRRRVRPLRQIIAFRAPQEQSTEPSPATTSTQESVPPPPARTAVRSAATSPSQPAAADASPSSPSQTTATQTVPTQPPPKNTIPFTRPAAHLGEGTLYNGPRQAETPLMREVNRILDKINASGINSLSEAERQTLDRASEILRR